VGSNQTIDIKNDFFIKKEQNPKKNGTLGSNPTHQCQKHNATK
jgi:hypothetical protein